ncbi:hypothetical protein [Microlunatus speluncae]|nr:hypothetical protein [Microlunatus speluncae]
MTVEAGERRAAGPMVEPADKLDGTVLAKQIDYYGGVAHGVSQPHFHRST